MRGREVYVLGDDPARCPPCPPCPPARTRRVSPTRPVLAPGAKGKAYGVRVKKRPGRAPTAEVWLQGRWLPELGFKGKAPFWVETNHETATLQVIKGKAPPGFKQRHVHKPKDPKKPVVIDLESRELLELFKGTSRVMVQLFDGRLVVRPDTADALRHQRIQARARRIQAGLPPLVGSCFTGAGFLDLAAEAVGYAPAFGIEVSEEYAGIYRANRARLFGGPERTPIHLGGVQAVVNENWNNVREGLPELLTSNPDLLVGGIPCQPYSKLSDGATVVDYWKKAVERGDRASAELAGLAPRFMQVVQQTNPYNVVVEQVSGFLDTQAHVELVQFLQSQGYHVTWKILYPDRMGWPTTRERYVLVATTEPVSSFAWPRQDLKGDNVWDWLTPPSQVSKKLPRSQGGWFTLGERSAGGKRGAARPGSWLWKKDGSGPWQRRKYKPQIVHPGSKTVRAVVKGYYNPDPSGPYVWHPKNRARPGRGWKPIPGDRYRLLTLDEVKLLHGVPEDYRLDLALGPFGGKKKVSPRNQCAVLGQGVVVTMFSKVIDRLPQGAVPRRKTAANPAEKDWWTRWRLGL